MPTPIRSKGVVAVVDLIGKRVLQLVDDEVVVPVPKTET